MEFTNTHGDALCKHVCYSSCYVCYWHFDSTQFNNLATCLLAIVCTIYPTIHSPTTTTTNHYYRYLVLPETTTVVGQYSTTHHAHEHTTPAQDYNWWRDRQTPDHVISSGVHNLFVSHGCLVRLKCRNRHRCYQVRQALDVKCDLIAVPTVDVRHLILKFE